jgi:hypothetical protein
MWVDADEEERKNERMEEEKKILFRVLCVLHLKTKFDHQAFRIYDFC